MKWHIKGADRQTGEDAEVWIEASKKEAAFNLASKTMLVDTIAPVAPPIEHQPHPPLLIQTAPRGMRLCSVCKNPIAANASGCPHCGKRYTSPVTWLAGGFVIFVIAIYVMYAMAGGGMK